VGAGRSITIADLVSGRELLALPPEGGEVWCLAWSPDGTKLAVGLVDGGVAVWDLEQVRARLAELSVNSPSTAGVGDAPAAPPIPAFDRVVHVNALRDEVDRARRLATAARDAGDYAAERDHLIAALNLGERLAEAVPDAAGHRERLAWTHAALARALARLGDTAAALSHLDVEADLLKRLSTDEPGYPDYRRLRAQGLTARSEILDRAGRRGEAVDIARQAVAVRGELASNPGAPNDQDQLGVVYNNLGFHLSRVGQTAEAERWYNTALAARDQLAHDYPDTAAGAKFRHSRGGTMHNLGVLRAQAGDSAGAAKLFREAVAIRTELADEFPTNAEYASDIGRTLDWLGGMLRNLGQLDEAAQRLREAAERQATALGARPKDSVFRDLCCNHHAQLATTLLRMGRHEEAASAARELPRLAHDNPGVLLRAARLLAECAAVAKRNPGPPWGVKLIQSRAYGGEAIALARQAVANGLTGATALLAKPDFDPVRDRDEFRALINELRSLEK
jgi:tetratricopeptide (TPR) repeat protein